MHDTYLIKNIADSIRSACVENQIAQISNLEVAVSSDSHITEDHFREHLQDYVRDLVTADTKIHIEQDESMERLTAVVKSIQGNACE